jgi:hypothetical protein
MVTVTVVALELLLSDETETCPDGNIVKLGARE